MKVLQEIADINTALIEQNRKFINTVEWENESVSAKANYAAGYLAALEFINNQLTRVQRNEPLHHLEQRCDWTD